MNIRQELETIRSLIQKSYHQGGVLNTIITGQSEASPYFAAELDKLVSGLEKTVLHARYLNEYCYHDIQPLEKTTVDFERNWSETTPTGTVEVDQNGWLHITLNTLLPHCKKGGNPLLRDTITRLLYGYKQGGGQFPHFEQAMLVIDEHCNIESRRVFDQDNKGWKVIPNALKGLVIADDDQFSLSVALTSTRSDVPSCQIHVMDLADAGTYFSLLHGDCGAFYGR